MKRLFLLRHAKAVPAESGIEDFDRTLMLSGMQDGGAMARYLGKGDHKVELILSSSAARTAQTAELVVQQLDCEIEYRDALYLAEPAKIMAAVRGAPAAISSLMIVGHNPGLESCVALLAREPVRRKERARHEAPMAYPTDVERADGCCQPRAGPLQPFSTTDQWRRVLPGWRQAGATDFGPVPLWAIPPTPG